MHELLKLRERLESISRLWACYVEENEALQARLAADGAAPTWQDTLGWARWLLTTREKQTADGQLKGRTRDTVEVYLKHAMEHLWRHLYPSLGEMSRAEWSGYWATVMGKVQQFFTDEGRDKWCAAAAAEARASEARRGGDVAAQAAVDAVLVKLRPRLCCSRSLRETRRRKCYVRVSNFYQSLVCACPSSAPIWNIAPTWRG